MKPQSRIVSSITLALLVVGFGSCVYHINGPRVIGRAVAPDGTEMCIVQKCNWSAEPFTTSFLYRTPKGQWGWFYFDHQDWYWSSSRAVLDTNAHKAVFYRGHSPAVTFDWTTETYTLHRWNRTMTGAQQQMPAGWSP
jgi:hypothetical protein